MRHLVFVALPIMSLLAALSLGTQAQSQADYEAKLKALKSSISKLQSELRAVLDSRNSLQDELQRSETDIGDLIKKIEQIKSELKEHKQQLDDLNDQRHKVKEEQDQQQQQIARQISTSYRLGRQNNLKLLLNQDEPDRVSRMLKYYDYFLSARAGKLNAYLETIAEIDRIEPMIKKKPNNLIAVISA